MPPSNATHAHSTATDVWIATFVSTSRSTNTVAQRAPEKSAPSEHELSITLPVSYEMTLCGWNAFWSW